MTVHLAIRFRSYSQRAKKLVDIERAQDLTILTYALLAELWFREIMISLIILVEGVNNSLKSIAQFEFWILTNIKTANPNMSAIRLNNLVI